jgi:hypothetical protein
MEDSLEDDEFRKEDVDGEGGEEVQEIEEGTFEGVVAKGKAVRTGNYSEFKDVILAKAKRSLDGCHDRHR